MYWELNTMRNTISLKENRHEHNNIQKIHSHEHVQILFVLDKSGEIAINYKSFLFDRGTLVFIPPFTEHTIESQENMIVLDLEFNREKLDTLNQELLNRPFFNEPKVFSTSTIEAGEIKRIFRRMLYESSKESYLEDMTLKINLAQLFVLLLKSPVNKKPGNANELRATKIQEYIDTHYYEIYGGEHLANKFQLSTRHLTTIFKERLGLTPKQYLNKVRINEAEQRLIQTENKITTICFEVGFESLATFYRQFKSHTKFSPKVYRHQFKRK